MTALALWFQLNDPDLPLWNRRFAERHRAEAAAPGWRRSYEYEARPA